MRLFAVILLCYQFLHADIPTECTVDEMLGVWKFYVSDAPNTDRTFDCSSLDVNDLNYTENITVTLTKPNIATIDGNTGRWSAMDIEGFDVYINGFHYQAWLNWTSQIDDNNKTIYTSNCSETLVGWVRQDIIHPDNISCFYGVQQQPEISVKELESIRKEKENHPVREKKSMLLREDGIHYSNRKYVKNPKFMAKPSNNDDKSWRGNYPPSVDWSSYTDGLSYTDPVYDQSRCGSCYVFGSVSALEAQLLISTGRQHDISISQQDVTSCGVYSQKCAGGFTEEVGFWAKDHGVVTTKCFPYLQFTATNFTLPDCTIKCTVDEEAGINTDRIVYAQEVNYLGGYYGNCSEQLMVDYLQQGPIAVSIAAGVDAFYYAKAGDIVFSDSDDPVDHVVLLVGYGTDPIVNVPYWKIKNSWGTGYGDTGYIRVFRGNNTIQIESEAEYITPYIGNTPRPQSTLSSITSSSSSSAASEKKNTPATVTPMPEKKSHLHNQLALAMCILGGLFVVALAVVVVLAVMLYKKESVI